MKDYLSLSCTPLDEKCVQVSSTKDYFNAMKLECSIFKRQLERTFPNTPDNAYFTVKTFPHDFGSYCEVCVVFDDQDEKACEFAYDVEGNLPETWDDIARGELEKIEGYKELIQ